MAFPGTKHGPRRRPYKVLWGDRGNTTVNQREWAGAVASGWIMPIVKEGKRSDRIARVTAGVIATLTAGELLLKNARDQFYRINTSWSRIDRRAPMNRGEFYQKEIERQYAPVAPSRDANVFDRWGQFEGPGGEVVRL
jgi:hypothetical protein